MNKYYLGFILAILPILSFSQVNLTYQIDVTSERKSISDLIYGVNQTGTNDALTTVKFGSRRLGGNRMSGYNWENNASNAGRDFYHQSDTYMCSSTGVSWDSCNKFAEVYRKFHQNSLSMNSYSLITVQMADYVAKTKNNVRVPEDKAAPSIYWAKTMPVKPTYFSMPPDTTDSYVYMDEMVSYFVNKFGSSLSPNGIKAYSLDNEPGLWHETHPRIHPQPVKAAEMVYKSIQYAKGIKSVDPYAKVFGGVYYGFSEHLNMNNAPDWTYVKGGFKTYTEYFLSKMKYSSDSIGYRLIDVLDIHWYPEATGKNDEGTYERVYGGGNDRGVAEARMQCVRSFWDATFKERSWIADVHHPISLFPKLQSSINTYNPGTLLAVTEYDFGGSNHISGGIATADFLGVCGWHCHSFY